MTSRRAFMLAPAALPIAARPPQAYSTLAFDARRSWVFARH
jgi:hypothetical protein